MIQLHTHTRTHTYSLFSVLFHDSLLQNIAYSSLCYTVNVFVYLFYMHGFVHLLIPYSQFNSFPTPEHRAFNAGDRGPRVFLTSRVSSTCCVPDQMAGVLLGHFPVWFWCFWFPALLAQGALRCGLILPCFGKPLLVNFQKCD